MSDLAETVDVVIVGGGSAGAVLAARLSQDPARTVLLLEAGQAYAPDAYPPGLLDANRIADPAHDWGYTSRGTIQSPRLPAPRGKVLGGSSAVNATVALRARPADFAKWGAHGAEGWSFDDVLGSLRPTGGALALLSAVVQPEATGTLKLASRDPGVAPLIDPNYLGTSRDTRRLLEAVKLGRAIARHPVFAPFIAGELTPGDAVADDDALAQAIAANPAVYGHPTSTAPMGGPGDPWAVVDSVGAVRGVSGLRVADASIIPEVPSSTTNVTVIMLAERIYQRVYAS